MERSFRKEFSPYIIIKPQVLSLFLILLFTCGCLVPTYASGIIALCYHQVVPKAKGLFEISIEDFREQLSILKTQGYEAITTRQLPDLLAGRLLPMKKPVLLTFDDGYRSVYDYAFPIMKEYGFVGVACIYPQFINTPGGMNWDQLRELASAGWSIECHSMTHANLWKAPTALAARQAFFEREIIKSKQIIEKNIGEPVRFIVWPYGIYTEETESFARKAGYLGALTVDGGASYQGLDPFRVKRQVVYRTDTREKFLIRLGMGPLQVVDPFPRPGQVLPFLESVSCRLPAVTDYTPDNYVLNAKITGGLLDFTFDSRTQSLKATPKNKLKEGQHFIDIYLRDKRTGVTMQHGWLFTISSTFRAESGHAKSKDRYIAYPANN